MYSTVNFSGIFVFSPPNEDWNVKIVYFIYTLFLCGCKIRSLTFLEIDLK